MAQLSHVNVVPVYEVADIEEGIAIAMELVEGQDLSEWSQDDHPWRERVRVVVEAGRGLAAAHAAGMVHRDFKPHNVLVGEDGRVRVTDFGLARLHRTAEPLDSEASQGDEPDRWATLTETGGIVGTPAYLAPEVYEGAPADERSDQFSYAVAAYQALYGKHPFQRDSLQAVAAAIIFEAPTPAPSDTGVPRRVRAAIARGLARDPQARFESVAAMVSEIERALLSRRWGAALGAIVVLGAGALWAVGRPEPACPDPAPELAGVWDEATIAEVGRAFADSGAVAAEDAWPRVRTRIDAYTSAWLDSRLDACEAAKVRGEQTQRLADLRHACLDRGRDELAALAQQLRVVDPILVDHALVAIERLPPVERCNDAESVQANPLEPPPEATRGAVRAAYRELSRVSLLVKTGHTDQAAELLEDLVPRATELGYVPLQARAQLERARVLRAQGDTVEWKVAEEAAFDLALVARDDETAVMAAGKLSSEAAHAREFAEGARWLATVDTLVRRQRLGKRWRAHVEELRGMAARDRKDYDAADAALQRAIALYDAAGGGQGRQIELQIARSAVAVGQGRYEDALQLVQESVDHATEAFGPGHSDVARALASRGSVRAEMGDLVAGREDHLAARAIVVSVYGDHHPKVIYADKTLGVLEMRAGRYEEARARLENALEISTALYPDDHARVEDNLRILQGVYNNLERFDEARTVGERLLNSIESTRGADDPELPTVHFELAKTARAQGRFADARASFERAGAMLERREGSNHPLMAAFLYEFSRLDEREGLPEQALRKLQRAEKILETVGSPVRRAKMQMLSAQMLLDLGRRAEARASAEKALAGFRAAGENAGPDLDKVQAWYDKAFEAPPPASE